MDVSLVLTVLGDDRPGLVETLSDVLEQHEGNWLESRMVDLAGKFAGLLRVSVPTANSEALTTALADLQAKGLDVLVQVVADMPVEEQARTLQLEVLGPDAPGIISHITRKLAELKVNLDELSSEQRLAPMSNEKLFFAEMKLELPVGVTEDNVQDALEDLSDQLMVSLVMAQES